MKCDLAVGSRAQMVPGALKFVLDSLVVVKLAVDNYVLAFIFTRDRLVARSQVDDAKPGVTESYSPIGRDPMSLPVGTTVMESASSCLHRQGRDRFFVREQRDDSAHDVLLTFFSDFETEGLCGRTREPAVIIPP